MRLTAGRPQVPLAGYTTLGLGGPAATLAEPIGEAGLVAAVRRADDRGEPVLVLGGGSNVVIADAGFPGLAVRVATRGISFAPADPDGTDPDGTDPGGTDPGGTDPGGTGAAAVALTVAAGEKWDDVVARSVAEGLAGPR